MNLPTRKPTRLKGYDYSAPGAYFVTVCVQGKQHLLGKVVGGGDFDAPQMKLSPYGKILDKYIAQMSVKYPHIQMDNYVIMPNHFHCLIRITEKNGRSETALPYNGELSKFISLLKRYCNRDTVKIFGNAPSTTILFERKGIIKKFGNTLNSTPASGGKIAFTNKKSQVR